MVVGMATAVREMLLVMRESPRKNAGS
jgi:hypothetical protein